MSLRGAAKPGLSEDGKESRWNVELTIASADPEAGHRGENKLPGKVNYFKGPKAQWKTDIPTYGRVRYKRVLPGIDVAYYGDGRSLEYDFVVSPGSDPGAIALKFKGQSGLSLDENGALVLLTGLGKLVNKRPVVYQEKNGRRRPIEGSYKLLAADTVGFTIGQYDKTAALIIDPEIVYCGYIGGSSPDYGYGIAVDTTGAAYVVGRTNSTEADFPETVGPGLTYQGGDYDAFAAKISADGSSLVYCGYIGGLEPERCNAIAVDSSGAAYVTGYTSSTDDQNFPVTGGPDREYNGGSSDAFVAKVATDGSSLDYCGYIGGSNIDIGYGIAVDSSGAAYVTGVTWSDDGSFPVAVGPDREYNGDRDAFVAKVATDGLSLDYCGYIGGSEPDYGYGIAVDSSGAAYVTGDTKSTQGQNFPVTVGPNVTHNGDKDAFVAKVATDGSSLDYCGYIGGPEPDYGYGIAVDSSGAAYVTGQTRSDEASFPVTVGPGLTFQGGDWDAFATKIKADGSSLDYCGYIGGASSDYGYGIAVDSSGAAYVSGSTASDEASFPVAVGPDLSHNGGDDAFAAKIKADGSSLDYCGYIGGSSYDYGRGVAVDTTGAAYVAGYTRSDENSFPVAVGPGLTCNGVYMDAFVAKIAVVEHSDGDRSRQAGGPTDKLGGGGNNPPPLALDGSVTNITPGQGGNLSQTRMLPLASPGGGTNGSAAIINSGDGPPGLMIQLTAPGGDSTQSWLPLEGTGRTPMGIGWATTLRFNYDVQVVDLTLDWPSETVSQMTPGRWIVSYWFQTATGACSNKRREYLDVTGASATERLTKTAQSELTFNLMLSVFDSGQRWVNRVTDGLVECMDDDRIYSSVQVSDGLVSINVPLGRTSYLVFSSDEFVGQRTLRCQFSDGILKIRDEDNAKDPVAYYKNPDGAGYCLEYYRDKLFICNPGPSNGPIMGRLYGK